MNSTRSQQLVSIVLTVCAVVGLNACAPITIQIGAQSPTQTSAATLTATPTVPASPTVPPATDTPLPTLSVAATSAPPAPPPAITVIVQPPAAATATRTRTFTPTRTATAPPPTSHQVYGAIEVPAGATREVRAKCPSGELRTGGGFVTHSDMSISTSQPIDANDWLAAGKNNSAATAVLEAYAICVANAPGSVVSRSAQVSLAPTKVGTPVATCPAGSFVTGGGHTIDPSIRVFWSRYSTSNTIGWEARAQNTSGSNQVLYSFAVCYSGTGGSIEVAKDGAIFASSIHDIIAACPSPRVVTGGGFTLEGGQLSARGSLISQNGWSIIASNTANYPLGVSSGAVCTMFQ